MYKIGVTGGIASGKTTLSKYLSEFKYARSMNMDLAAHKLYNIDYYLRKELVSRFGNTILRENKYGIQELNRGEVAKIVFSSSNNLRRLNELIHPRLMKYLQCELDYMIELPKEIRPDVLFIEGAVIIEGGWAKYFDELWVTTLSKEEGLKRVLKRNKDILKSQAEERINMQITDEERLKYAKFWYNTIKPFKENKSLINKELQRLKLEGKLKNNI